MNDNQLLRYSRHILLEEVGIDVQQTWLDSHALVIGAGGLGSPVSLYLAAAGVGRISVCDPDTVDLTNLQRQIIHQTDSVGRPKVDSARDTLARINPESRVIPIPEKVSGERLESLVADADIVVDCCDNFATRHAVNRACVKHRKPLVSGAGVRFDGQVAVFDARSGDGPCYHCLFPETGDPGEMRCAVMGVFAPVVGIIGSIQAAEALKVLGGLGEPLAGRLLILDALAMQWRQVRVPRDPACAVCSGDVSALTADTAADCRS
ncbi:MAG: molybdopterin-synthase adenylyltransferase MoeB [Betaproteobacteria bacterium]